LDELTTMFKDAGVSVISTKFYRLAVGLERCLQATATAHGAAEEVRRIHAADIGRDETGMLVQRVGDTIQFSFPVVVVAGRKEQRWLR